MLWSFTNTIWLYPKPIDFRLQMNGLIMLVADHLKLDPISGQLFLFRNRHANKIKILWWEHNGFWLCYKRLERDKLIFPEITTTPMQLTTNQLSWLLSGLNFTKYPLQSEVKATNFY